MQKECKDRKSRESIELFKSSMIRSESEVPDSDKTLLYSGISGSGFEPGFAMIEMISEVYKFGVLFAVITNGLRMDYEWTDKLEKEIENDVQVTGYVSQYPDGKNRILVTGYEVLRDEDYF